tara:strand:- start:1284 stop:2276 length:993 start_codon:yes stop_codon:yes gene_type:complete
MKILITGGAGFIGSHTVESLINEKNIKKILIIDNFEDGSKKNLKKVLKNKKIQIFKRDINNIKSIQKLFKNINSVIHLAALSDIVPSIESPIEYLNTNIMGTLNVLECMRKHKIKKIIYSASSSCYGNDPKVPTNENSEINTKYPYAFSKFVGEKLIQHYANVYGINYISLRLFNVYGTRSRTNSAYGAALGVFIKQKISNHPYTIIGKGNQKRDFIYVADVVDVIKKSLTTSKKNKVYNIGAGSPKSINFLVKILKGPKIFIPKRPGEPSVTHANISKVKKELNWKPKTTLENGLQKVLKNKEYWKNAPLWTRSKIRNATKYWFKYLSK